MEVIRWRATETPFKERENTLGYAGLFGTPVLGTSKSALDTSAWLPTEKSAYNEIIINYYKKGYAQWLLQITIEFNHMLSLQLYPINSLATRLQPHIILNYINVYIFFRIIDVSN